MVDLAAMARVCTEISDGHYLKDICLRDDMPSRPTVYRWMAESTEAQDMYARAREERADIWADEVVKVADTETDAAIARNRIDARKWAAAKGNPKRYSDKHIQVVEGGETPVSVEHSATSAIQKLAALLRLKTS